ncbi:HTH-type transcriptional regulator ZntR [bacterium HR08]|nr:HTH-type transcriptional regulator ZntR [bacterium HR08]
MSGRTFYIGELARAVGVKPQTVRYYEREGLLGRAARTRSGYRLYDEEALLRLRFIRAAQALGLSLAEIRELVVLSREGRSPCARVRTLLREKLRALDQKIAELRAFRRELAARLAQLDAMPDQADSSPYVCSLIMTLARRHRPDHGKEG